MGKSYATPLPRSSEVLLTRPFEVVEGLFPDPPSIAYVARTRPKTPNAAVKALVQEISREVRNAIPLRVA